MLQIPTDTITFPFIDDIEGNTQLWEKFPEQIKLNLAHHDCILHSVIGENDGIVFKSVWDTLCAAIPTTHRK